MNWDQIAGDWKQFSGKIREKWGKLTDDEVAAVLTYIRREWGNAASPVDAATAQAIRALSATRTRPWTDEELARIGDGAVR